MERIINNTDWGGTYDNDFIQNYPEIVQGWVFTNEECNPNFIVKKWNGVNWYEGATPEEIVSNNISKNAEFEEEIIKRYNYLMMRALSSSMGKYGSFEYLQNQKSEYDEKYAIAKGLKVSAPLANSLEKEMNRDFTDESLIATLQYFGIEPSENKLENFYKLIVFKYEYAEYRYEFFKAFCVDYRTKCRSFLETSELAKLQVAFEMADTLPNELTNQDIETMYNQFDAL